jgi:hypothetical protein
MMAGVVIRFARIILLEQPIARLQPQGRRAALSVGCGCALLLILAGLYPAPLLSLVSQVQSPGKKSIPDTPGGSNRGAATAQLPH